VDQNCLVHRQLAGGVPGQGVVVVAVKGVEYAPIPPGMYENSKKTAFPTLFGYTLFFAQKYLTRYTPETFFEEYINL
jgi:hypothetical protein